MTEGALIKSCLGMGRTDEKMRGHLKKEEVKGGAKKSKCLRGGYVKF